MRGSFTTMAMPQRDAKIEAIKRLEPPSRVRYGALGACGRLRALRVRRWRISPPKRSFYGASLEYAVEHNDEAEADRLRAELRKLTEEI